MTEPVVEPAPSPPDPAMAPEPVQRRHRAALVLALGFIVVVAAIGIVFFLVPPPWGAPARSNPEAALAVRLDRLEAAQSAQARAIANAGTADQSALGKLDQWLQALETRPPPAPPDLTGIQQQIAALGSRVDATKGRVDALDKAVQAQPAGDPTDAALALIALQIGEAVRNARPFEAEYQSFALLAHDRPELAAAAAPLAEPAKAGIAGRAVLARELHALAGRTAIAAPPPPDGDWGDLILARLRGLVTIRRIDGVGQSPGQTSFAAAEKAMEEGDLRGAVQALQTLSGAQADAARPWLQMANARLQVESGLRHLTTLLAARLGKPAAAKPAPPG